MFRMLLVEYTLSTRKLKSLKIILATIAIKGRLISFSSEAFKELELLLAMFEKLPPHPIIKGRLVSYTKY